MLRISPPSTHQSNNEYLFRVNADICYILKFPDPFLQQCYFMLGCPTNWLKFIFSHTNKNLKFPRFSENEKGEATERVTLFGIFPSALDLWFKIIYIRAELPLLSSVVECSFLSSCNFLLLIRHKIHNLSPPSQHILLYQNIVLRPEKHFTFTS
jgi:hypothetical protein